MDSSKACSLKFAIVVTFFLSLKCLPNNTSFFLRRPFYFFNKIVSFLFPAYFINFFPCAICKNMNQFSKPFFQKLILIIQLKSDFIWINCSFYFLITKSRK